MDKTNDGNQWLGSHLALNKAFPNSFTSLLSHPPLHSKTRNRFYTRPTHAKMPSWPSSTHHCCCVSCLSQGCYRLPQELQPDQLSAGTERANEMGKSRESKWQGEIKPHTSLWGMRNCGTIRASQLDRTAENTVSGGAQQIPCFIGSNKSPQKTLEKISCLQYKTFLQCKVKWKLRNNWLS